jgi:hypothetical protein
MLPHCTAVLRPPHGVVLVLAADLLYCLISAGPCPAFLLTAVLRAGKRQVGGKVAYAGSIRHKDPLQCCHGALARNFVVEYTLQRKPFPSPEDTELWRHNTPVWMGCDDQRSMSYTQQYDSQRAYMAEAGINVRKVTHAWRSHKARDLDEQGLEDDVSVTAGQSVQGTCVHVLARNKCCLCAGQNAGGFETLPITHSNNASVCHV